MKIRFLLARTVAFTPVLLGGCMVGPDYTRPVTATPPQWKESTIATDTVPAAAGLPSAWWKIFGDAELDALETAVLAANPDLQRAVARVAEARALARLSAAESFPNVAHQSASSRQRPSANRADSPAQVSDASDYSTGLQLGYELDFWGRVRRTNEAAYATSAAVAGDHQVAQLILTSDTARFYLQLRALDAERQVIEATLALRRDAVHLQETRHQAGLINEVDATRARTELAGVEAELHAVARSRARLEHALAVLSGQPPATFAVAPRLWAGEVPHVPVGLPSSLLERRPDIATAGHRLHAATAQIGVAKADFFPRISLTAAAGFASADLSSLLEKDSRAWSFGPSVYLPLFDGGRIRANHQAAEARAEQQAAAYRGTVLNAFREVEDALSDLRHLGAQNDAVQRGLASARDTASLATERYQRGLSNYLDVVDAQRGVFQAERQATQLHAERAIATLLLVKALGGGWERPETVAAD